MLAHAYFIKDRDQTEIFEYHILNQTEACCVLDKNFKTTWSDYFSVMN